VAPSIELLVDFAPDDRAISNLHGRAFGHESPVLQPWTDRLLKQSLTWVGAFLQDELAVRQIGLEPIRGMPGAVALHAAQELDH
jgi:hypothetical protein